MPTHEEIEALILKSEAHELYEHYEAVDAAEAAADAQAAAFELDHFAYHN